MDEPFQSVELQYMQSGFIWYPTLQHRCKRPNKYDENDKTSPPSELIHFYYSHSMFERLSVEEQNYILALTDKEETGEIDMEQEANDEENEEVTDDIGSSSHSKKHPDGVFFRNETALRYTSAYDALVRVAKTVPVFKPFIGGTLAESTSSQHTLLKNRLVFYPAAHDTLPKTNNAKDDERWLATMVIDALVQMVNIFPKALLPDG
ncbi:hypothetical protein K457DRAFT_128752 [Linnemannia elongata AG-77]|uniref:Uncharacterized protein n=1 Tax=Linnemannia elongata AG-77 TaxID=1314771 RepID=A0A197JKD9_9FUNG|nr:hypothetical protein K457DRAFT_128752 [Linnemannia elongata AG-77]